MTYAVVIDGPEGFNPIQDFGGLTPMHYITLILRRAEVPRVIYTSDVWFKEIESHTRKAGGENLWRKDSEANSLSVAMRVISGKCDRVLIGPPNFPLCEVETAILLANATEPIVAPAHNGVRGYPFSIAAEHFEELGKLGNLGKFLEAHSDDITLLEVNDIGVVTDILTDIDEANRLAQQHTINNKYHPKMKLTIRTRKDFFGPGLYQFLRLIQETNSVDKSSTAMGMAPKHIMNRIRNFEKKLGVPVIFVANRGAHGRHAEVTPEGAEFLDLYEEFEQRAEAAIMEIFEDTIGRKYNK